MATATKTAATQERPMEKIEAAETTLMQAVTELMTVYDKRWRGLQKASDTLKTKLAKQTAKLKASRDTLKGLRAQAKTKTGKTLAAKIEKCTATVETTRAEVAASKQNLAALKHDKKQLTQAKKKFDAMKKAAEKAGQAFNTKASKAAKPSKKKKT